MSMSHVDVPQIDPFHTSAFIHRHSVRMKAFVVSAYSGNLPYLSFYLPTGILSRVKPRVCKGSTSHGKLSFKYICYYNHMQRNKCYKERHDLI